MRGLLQDLGYGVRMLTKTPGFAAVAILTLALGIGANTAIFSMIDGILLRSLPVRDAQSVVVLKWSARKAPRAHNTNIYGYCGIESSGGEAGSDSCSFTEPFFHQVAAQRNLFSSVAAFANGGPLDLSGNGAASVLTSQAVSGEYFSLLKVRAAAGRLIAASDDSVSAPPVVVIRYGYWKTQFGGSPSAIGKTVRLNNIPFTIIGVAEKQFDSLSPGSISDVWIPLSTLQQVFPDYDYKTRATDPGTWWLLIIGRLNPSVSRMQAQAAVSTMFRNAMLQGDKASLKAEDNPKVAALPAQTGLAGGTAGFSSELRLLMAAVGVVLLIACANVAGLLLSRVTARQKEMAVRMALGAGRWRIIRQLLTESLLLSTFGGLLGIFVAVWGIDAIEVLLSNGADQPFGYSPGINGRVLAFTIAASVITGIVFGLAPASRGTRVNLTPALKEGTGSSAAEGRAGHKWFSLGNGLVVAQVGLAVVVLVGAGLLVRTFRNIMSIDPGFDTKNVITFHLEPTLIGYKAAQVGAFYRDLQTRLAAMPRVDSVSFSDTALLSGDYSMTGFQLPGKAKGEGGGAAALDVGADFFSTMRMKLLAGRDFNASDFAEVDAQELRADAARKAKAAGAGAGTPKPAATPAASEPPVPVIVNKLFVSKYFSKVNPLGQRFGSWEANAAEGMTAFAGYEIVGVVNDAKYQGVQMKIDPTMYRPLSGRDATFEVRTRASAAAMTAAIRGLVNQMDSSLPVTSIQTETQIIENTVSQARLMSRLSGFFGILALVLACIGLYGLLAYEVARRTREIGIRMALGAQRRDVMRLVMRQGITLAIAGSVIGVAVARGVTKYLSTMLYGIQATDASTFAGVAVILTVVALAACYIPARRAMSVDPMVALRYE